MANLIIIDKNWKHQLKDIGKRFNNFAKKGSMRRVSILIDEVYDIAADDRHPSQQDALVFLLRVREVNQRLISRYVSALIDAKLQQDNDANFLTPSPTISEMLMSNPSEGEDPPVMNDSEEEKDDDSGDGLLTWDMGELLKFKIIKDVYRIKYEKIKDQKLKKCACGDGVLDKNSIIWSCKECGTAYHENCVKLVALLEGKCRICDHSFLGDEEDSD